MLQTYGHQGCLASSKPSANAFMVPRLTIAQSADFKTECWRTRNPTKKLCINQESSQILN